MISSIFAGNSILGMVIGFVVTLVPLIILHEIGHMLVAKYFGVWAKEFGIGYPPRITKLFQWQETVFTLNWLPLGGFVRLEGEAMFEEEDADGDETSEPVVEAPNAREAAVEAQKHSLYAKPPWQQILIYLSGPMMNILTAWLVAVLIFTIGIPSVRVKIEEVAPNSPAAQAGMQAGDIIAAINGHEVEDMIAVTDYTQRNLGQSMDVTLERGNERLTVSLTPRENPPEGEGSMGILIGGIERPDQLRTYPPGEALQLGTGYVVRIAAMSFSVPVQVLRGTIAAEDARPVGIVGISRIAGDSMETSIEKGALYPILNLIALVSASLGLFNLLPIPALDGGRILFSLIEMIRHKPLTPQLQEKIHLVTMMLLMVLFIVITIFDIIAPIPGA